MHSMKIVAYYENGGEETPSANKKRRISPGEASHANEGLIHGLLQRSFIHGISLPRKIYLEWLKAFTESAGKAKFSDF